MPGFDPLRLSPSASLNRVRIMDLPGVPLPGFVRGKTAYDLLSSAATATWVRQHALGLGLAHVIQAPDGLLLRLVSSCFEAPDQKVRKSATWIAEVYGQALACLIATLHRGDEINRAARPEWDDDVWTHWATVKRVRLGGGMASGRFGEVMVQVARACLPKLGVRGVQLERATYPNLLPLLGVAHSIPEGTRRAIVLDFGHSFVKRAGVSFHDEALGELRCLSDLSAFANETMAGTRELADRMVATIATTLQEAGHANDMASMVVASVAGYFVDDHPLPEAVGRYAELRQVTPNAGKAISELASAQLGRKIKVSLLHDGSCAARAFAGEAHTAVIMLGTSLGVGFAPTSPLHSLTPTFTVIQKGADTER